jgi:hypothetical protein
MQKFSQAAGKLWLLTIQCVYKKIYDFQALGKNMSRAKMFSDNFRKKQDWLRPDSRDGCNNWFCR